MYLYGGENKCKPTLLAWKYIFISMLMNSQVVILLEWMLIKTSK